MFEILLCYEAEHPSSPGVTLLSRFSGKFGSAVSQIVLGYCQSCVGIVYDSCSLSLPPKKY